MGAAAGTMEHRRAAYRVPFIILYYSLCSSTLIVINKVAIHNLKVSSRLLVHNNCSWLQNWLQP
jgi:hypothetical protein